MPGRNIIKFITSLKHKKYRRQHRLFIIEGEKMVEELSVSGLSIHSVYATGEWIREHGSVKDLFKEKALPLYEISKQELSRISTLSTPNNVLAVVHIPSREIATGELACSLSLVLDNIQDPGNLGTLVRSADWFGIHNIILSSGSAEVTSPKVVQSTMGSILRVNTYYADLPSFLKLPEISKLPVYGAFTMAPDLYSIPLENRGLIVLGNESHGISAGIEKLVTRRFSIPSFPGHQDSAESLNVAVAGSIIISEFRRREKVTGKEGTRNTSFKMK
jgi:RNA methyltransferase, TrmH family